jgi:hypothetical protein
VLYQPEEQLLRLPSLDGRADIYALGVVLYHLIAGRLIYPGNADHAELFELILGEEPRDIAALAPWLHQEAVRVIRRAMARKAEHRYQTMTEFADALRRALSVVAHEAARGMALTNELPANVNPAGKTIEDCAPRELMTAAMSAIEIEPTSGRKSLPTVALTPREREAVVAGSYAAADSSKRVVSQHPSHDARTRRAGMRKRTPVWATIALAICLSLLSSALVAFRHWRHVPAPSTAPQLSATPETTPVEPSPEAVPNPRPVATKPLHAPTALEPTAVKVNGNEKPAATAVRKKRSPVRRSVSSDQTDNDNNIDDEDDRLIDSLHDKKGKR